MASTVCRQARALSSLADNYILQQRFDDARVLFERLLALQNDLGLLAEEYDPRAGRMLGNFPQAFSHVGLKADCFLPEQYTISNILYQGDNCHSYHPLFIISSLIVGYCSPLMFCQRHRRARMAA